MVSQTSAITPQPRRAYDSPTPRFEPGPAKGTPVAPQGRALERHLSLPSAGERHSGRRNVSRKPLRWTPSAHCPLVSHLPPHAERPWESESVESIGHVGCPSHVEPPSAIPVTPATPAIPTTRNFGTSRDPPYSPQPPEPILPPPQPPQPQHRTTTPGTLGTPVTPATPPFGVAHVKADMTSSPFQARQVHLSGIPPGESESEKRPALGRQTEGGMRTRP